MKGTDWITVDQLSCFVGVNESGKTNLLLPLWKFNPADDATEVDLLQDYPRDEYHELDEKGGRKNESFIEVLFKITKEEVEFFEKLHADYQRQQESEDEEGTTKKIKKIGFSDYIGTSAKGASEVS